MWFGRYVWEPEPSCEVSITNQGSGALMIRGKNSSWCSQDLFPKTQPCYRDCWKKKSVPSKMQNAKPSQGNIASFTAATSSASWSKGTYTVKYLESICKCSGFTDLYLDTHVSNLGHALPKWCVFRNKIETEECKLRERFPDNLIMAVTLFQKLGNLSEVYRT